MATLHRPTVRLRVTPSRAIVALPIQHQATRLPAHPVRRRVIAAIRQTRRHPTAALPRRDRMVRADMADIAEAEVIPAAGAAEAAVIPAAAAVAAVIRVAAVEVAAVVPEAVRPGDVQGAPRAAAKVKASRAKQSGAVFRPREAALLFMVLGLA